MDRVCPLLALAADHRSVVDGVDNGHRCHSAPEPIALDRQLQAQVCLSAAHDRCERYRQHVARRRAVPGRTPVAGGLVSTRMVLAPEPAWRGIAGRARRSPPSRIIALGAALLVAVLTGVALAVSAASGQLSLLNAAPASPTAGIVVAPGPTMTSTVTDGPSVSAPATPRPAATPTSSPTGVPTAAAEPPTPPARTYVVQVGDTLADIAREFGTSVAALRAANGIEDADEIVVGETLVVP